MASANTKALPKLDYRTFIVLFCPQDKCFYRFFFFTYYMYEFALQSVTQRITPACWNVPEIMEHYLSNFYNSFRYYKKINCSSDLKYFGNYRP